ncbi:MAG: C40 family peptidase [Ktedonobacteraceae bacterium]
METITSDFIIAVSVADIRREPDASSELVTQTLMNTPAQAGQVVGEWTQVTLPDYSGWARTDQLDFPIVRGFCEGEGTCGIALPYSIVVTEPHTPLYRDEGGQETSGELYLSTALPYIDLAHPQRLRVALPGNEEGWLLRSSTTVRSNAELYARQDIHIVTAYAKAFLGVPYLWGGTSWRGIDCSAFVQLCYRMGGDILPRDADQQEALLTHSVTRDQMRAGDLIFFGQKQITHVAIALNRYEYIHAEGQHHNQVIIHSFDQRNLAYNQDLANKVWSIKRVRVE